jgi:hypothetical protein
MRIAAETLPRGSRQLLSDINFRLLALARFASAEWTRL